MSLFDTLVTTGAGALSATAGVVVGGLITRRSQDRQWLRDRQLAAVGDVFDHYARFSMELKRAHAEQRGWDYDWGAWSAALVRASLIVPAEVAGAIDGFGGAVDVFLDRVARDIDPAVSPLEAAEFEQASLVVAREQVKLVNAVRKSLGNGRTTVDTWIGGSVARGSAINP
ncbi:hypothetical protein ACFXHA_00110 [Nocardia sp. NPDC059240]|uniref:hypothetical protein n=1 Tax=Nocardia sp. NPDC059240 TaxID=3346786 RepID=UPI0036A7CD80